MDSNGEKYALHIQCYRPLSGEVLNLVLWTPLWRRLLYDGLLDGEIITFLVS